MSNILLAKLTSDDEWDALRVTLDAKRVNHAVESILAQLRSNGALSVVIEVEYLDQDFTAVYAAFYSTVFKRHSKLCRRLHFFAEDVTGVIDNANPSESTAKLEAAGKRAYLGFIVARPLAHSPLGRVVIAAPASSANSRRELLVFSDYEAHVLGATLHVRGIAMTQQETRVGACAQAAIWVAGRHFHMRHRGPWFSTAAITDVATKLTDNSISRSLPAGSEFLTPDNMLRALRAMDREPLLYAADAHTPPKAPEWRQVRPHDVIHRYVDSGIPVILGLCPLPGQTLGHAVLVTGRTSKELPAGSPLPVDPTLATFCDNFLVHDDQRGSNTAVSILPGTGTAVSPYTIFDNVLYLIAPLPKKVFLTAEHAEKISLDTLRRYAADWDAHKTLHAGSLGSSITTGDALVGQVGSGKFIARTYLTYGWRYKSRMLRNAVGANFKSVLFYHALPRFVWVTEFGTFESMNHLDVRKHRIFAHSVVDATASRFWESRSIFHAPGMSVRWFHDSADPTGGLKDAASPIADDEGYFPKVRGEDDYDLF